MNCEKYKQFVEELLSLINTLEDKELYAFRRAMQTQNDYVALYHATRRQLLSDLKKYIKVRIEEYKL